MKIKIKLVLQNAINKFSPRKTVKKNRIRQDSRKDAEHL